MRITVTGGSGFLASHVADKLSDAGHAVRIFDQKPSPWLREDQELILGDLLDMDKAEQAMEGADVVYHFAAFGDLNEARRKPLQTIKSNVLGTVSILEACVKHRVKRFMYASTVYVYSREGGFYRCSKQSAEHYVEEYQRVFGLDYTILRYGSLYGPRSNISNGLYKIVKDALQEDVVKYDGNSEAVREYIHVDDAAHSSVAVLGKEFVNQSIVLTGHESMCIGDLIKMLAEILGKPYVPSSAEQEKDAGHYVFTPYAYQPKLGRKYRMPLHVDLGQGLLQLIEEIRLNCQYKQSQYLNC